MLKRKKLHKLVIAVLDCSQKQPRAIELYELVKMKDEAILREQSVGSFRSFVKVINMYPDIQAVGSGVKQYMRK
jgi:hypothetical protein